MRRVMLAAAALVPSLALAEPAPMSRDAFCRAALDLSGDLLTQSAMVLAATAIQGLQETGDAAAPDPRVETSAASLMDAANALADQVLAFCQG